MSVTSAARRAPHPHYRRTEGIPRATGLHRRAFRRMGIDVWDVLRPGQGWERVVALNVGPWWARRERG